MANNPNFQKLLRTAYLKGNSRAVFEALNATMEYMPYNIDDPMEETIDNVPIWLLQAFREMIVFRIQNEKQKKVGAKPQDRMKYLAAQALMSIESEPAKHAGEDKYERAQKRLNEMGEGLQPETIKKYAAKFRRDDGDLADFGKYFGMGEEDHLIFEAVLKEM